MQITILSALKIPVLKRARSQRKDWKGCEVMSKRITDGIGHVIIKKSQLEKVKFNKSTVNCTQNVRS
jgi:hypothetical protein